MPDLALAEGGPSLSSRKGHGALNIFLCLHFGHIFKANGEGLSMMDVWHVMALLDYKKILTSDSKRKESNVQYKNYFTV